MKRNKIIPLCLSAMISAPFLMTSLAACSQGHAVDEVLVVENKSVITYEHSFSINFEFKIECNSEVMVEIIEPSVTAFWIKENTIQLNENKGTVEFLINDSIDVNSLFSFNLKFWYRTFDGAYHNQTIFGFNTYYLEEHAKDLDYPVVEYNTQEIVNKHVFKYIIWFDKKPQSDPINVELKDDATNKLSLVRATSPLIQDSGFYKIEIDINLDISVFTTDIFCFSLDIDFVNSYNIQQRNHFYGLTARFQKVSTDDIPLDYFDIEHQRNDRIILKGLKDGVNKLEAGHYKELVVPNGVTNINANAFADKNWFRNIRYIYIPSSVSIIRDSAFSGLDNITELDLIDYDNIPAWSTTHNIFDANNFKTIGGYIWTQHIDNLDEFNNRAHNWGLPQLWEAFNEDMVSQPNDFTLTSEGTILNDIKPTTESFEKWKHIKVIKIPKTVERISINAFERLKQLPFEKTTTNSFVDKYETRRLILNNKLNYLPEHAFQYIGISGPIIIYCDNLTTLPWGAFYDAISYDSPALLDVEEEPFYLILSDSFNITNVDDFCFNATPFANEDLIFPLSVEAIGRYAFQGHRFHTITFTHNLDGIGERAFANTFAYPSNPTITAIDCSNYKVVLNPSADPSQWTYTPTWMEQNNFIFEKACVDNDQKHYIYFSQYLHDEQNKKEGGFDKWFSDFRLKQGIPSSWEYKIK